MAIGFVVLVLVLALEMIGHLLGFQMAFSMATAFDPTFGSTNNILSIFLAMLATWMFLLLGGDHYVLQALHSSFTLLPPGHIVVRRGLLTLFSRLLTGAFAIGFQLAAPVIILLLAVDAVLGLISKTAARMQIFFVGLPLKIAVGLFAFTAILGLVRLVWGGLVMRLPGNLLDMFRLMVR
jgi:flagellar biosynthesis protein FliR